MNVDELLKYIKERAEYNFNYEGEISLDTPLSDFIGDEVDLSEYMIDFETKFKLDVTEEDQNNYFDNLKTVQDLVDFIMGKKQLDTKSDSDDSSDSNSKEGDIDMDKIEDAVDDVAKKAKGVFDSIFGNKKE